MPKPPARRPASTSVDVNGIVDKLANDANIESFSVRVSKKDGIARVSARTVDGVTHTKTVLGPGLQEQITYDPSYATKEDRDANIRLLRSKNLTQPDIAEKLGVSQSLVSKVLSRS